MINVEGKKSRVEKSYCSILGWFFLAIDHWLLTIVHFTFCIDDCSLIIVLSSAVRPRTRCDGDRASESLLRRNDS